MLSHAEVYIREMKVPSLQGNHAVSFLLFQFISEITKEILLQSTVMHKGRHTNIPERALTAAKLHV